MAPTDSAPQVRTLQERPGPASGVDARNVVVLAAGLGAAVLVLAVLTVLVGVDSVFAELGRADPRLVAVVAGAILTWLVLWGIGLRVVLAAVGTRISVVDAVLVHAGAAFANHVTPFGQAGGEPIAAWLLSDVSDAPFERSMAAITSFDVINVIPSLTFAIVGLAYYSAVATLGTTVQWLAAGVVVLTVVVPVVGVTAWRHRETVQSGIARVVTPPARLLGRLLPRVSPPTSEAVEERIGRFLAGLESVASDPRRVTAALALSGSGWLVQAAGLWVALLAVGVTVPPYVPLFVVPLGTVAGAMPTPGGLGGTETVQVVLLTAATTAAESAITAAVLIFSVGGFLLTTSVGAASATVIKLRRPDAEIVK